MAVTLGRQRIGCLATLLAVISAALWYITFFKDIYIMWRIVAGLLAIITLVGTVIGCHIMTLPYSKYAPMSHILKLYFSRVKLRKPIASKYKKFLQQTKDICRVQDQFLLARLRKHANTEYGRRFGFSEMSSSSDYRSRHPVTNYEHHHEYIERVANGKTSALLTEKPVQFNLTSGTTGKPKMIPRSEEQKKYFTFDAFAIPRYVMAQAKGLKHILQKSCVVYVDPSFTYSKSGIIMSPVSKAQKSDLEVYGKYSSTPLSGYKIAKERSAYYVHAIFSLRDRNIGMFQTYFSSVLYGFLRLIESEWESLVDDIERGKINNQLDLPSGIREDLERELVPDPERAHDLRQEFQRGFQGIVKRIWPFIPYFIGATSGSFTVYADILREKYCGGIPLYSAVYVTSEGILAVSLWPDDVKHRDHYLFLPDGAYFEFIPVDKSNEEQPNTLLLQELEIGESYELVITNMDGLYRYRIGDVIKVVDFFNQNPVFAFQYRIGEVLNIRGEKTSEDCIVAALSNTIKNWGNVELAEYACADNTIVDAIENKVSVLPYYVIFVEIRGLEVTNKQRELQTKQLDEALCNIATAYKFLRNKDAIGQLRLVAVRPGSFKALREFKLNNSTASSNQFKMPRKLRKQEWVELLLSREERTF